MPNPRVIAKRYELLAELGRGGFATVYRARDASLNRPVALKVIHGNYAQDPTFVERFRQEAQTAARLDHSNIVPVYDFGDENGTLYLAMALIEGRSLRGLLDERKRLTLDQALPILSQLADALDYLAEKQLVHRDIKPANVMIEREDSGLRVRLTDFGLVRSLEASSEITRSASILGSPAYMAPEQADAQKWGAITPATDVYALGVVAYEMLVGRLPFFGETVTMLHAHAYDAPAPPLEAAPDLGSDLADVLLRALAKPQADRCPSAGALVKALQLAAQERARQASQQSELAQLLEQARAAQSMRNWLEVQRLCVQIMQIDRAHPDALTLMTEATNGLQRENAEESARRQRAGRYDEGEAALANEQWQAAIAAFDEVAQGNPDFRDVQDRLKQARDELQRAQGYDEAIAHAEAEQWVDACRAWLAVLRGRWDYRKGEAGRRLLEAVAHLLAQLDTVRTAFDRQQRDLKQARESLTVFDALAVAVAAGNWEQAVTLGEQLLAAAPDLQTAPDWLTRARKEMQRLGPLGPDRMIWRADGKEMVRVPAGQFIYGDNQRLSLDEFWIDKTPVTNAEFERFVQASQHKTTAEQQGSSYVYNGKEWKETKGADWLHPAGPGTGIQTIMDHPVVNVSWEDAAAYAKWAGKRLPAEQEWEKAARGTDGRAYPWGNQEPTDKLCNFGMNVGSTTPVGQYSPQGDSPYGCVDMSGNVWEWTASDYDQNRKVLRGGSWNIRAAYVRAAYRFTYPPGDRGDYYGFRCVGAAQGG